MKIHKKEENKGINNILTYLGVLSILTAHFTDYGNPYEFFNSFTFIEFIGVFLRTLIVFLLFPSMIFGSIFIVFDLILLPFGLSFPIYHFLWDYVYVNVIVEWWYQSASSSTLILSIFVVYLFNQFEIRTKKYIINLALIRFNKENNKGFTVFLFDYDDGNKKLKYAGLNMGLVMIKKRIKNENE